MADDQRPYRSSDAIARAGQAKGAGSSSGNDPLAELARLIGQSDPFGEYARETARHPAEPQRDDARGYRPPTGAHDPQAGMPSYGAPVYDDPPYDPSAYDQQDYGYQNAPSEPYAVDGRIPAYLTQRGQDAAGYDPASYDPGNPPYGAEQQDFYDDAPPSRRRMGVLVIAGVFALAVLGTAGAFGYRAIFGTSGNGQPPVIKAETAPSKIVPASAGKDAASNKLITDRVGGVQGEKLVSREEQPIEVRDKPAGVVFPSNSGGGQPTASAASAPMGTGVIGGTEPKKIRTIAIHPDGSGLVADATGAMPAAESPRQAQPAPAPAPPQRTASVPASAAPNAPLSLNPNAQASAPAPARTASAPTQLAPPASSGGGAYVQLSSQRSQEDAQAAFRTVQGKFPAQLGSYQPSIRKVDLGAKGTYYRAMVGPLASSAAVELCTNLKAAGGQCIVQRN